jgi:hypothetical protein
LQVQIEKNHASLPDPKINWGKGTPSQASQRAAAACKYINKKGNCEISPGWCASKFKETNKNKERAPM